MNTAFDTFGAELKRTSPLKTMFYPTDGRGLNKHFIFKNLVLKFSVDFLF